MFKNKSYASAKKFILLASVLTIGCGGINYLGYHQGAHKAPPLAIKTLGVFSDGYNPFAWEDPLGNELEPIL
ncbi:hypothetical protein SAMN02910400_01719 [Lachnospiraceae bacterium C10]|nr:hypothetical protein SAMN02910400_01719 [Lachnospiraceae bacterium C10]